MTPSEPSPVKRSKIPHRPSSSGASSGGRRSPHSVSASGSPIRPSTAPDPLPNAVSMSASSKIPKAPRTPSNVPLPKSLKPKSGGRGFASLRSSIPRARNALDTPTIASPVALVYKKPSPLADRNKPLPSPPVAQIIDPNSPPKAQRTLVDAEAGTPSDDVWPILRPQTSNQAHTVSSANVAVEEQQRVQQQLGVPGSLTPTFCTETPVKVRNTTPSSAPNYSSKPVAFAIHDENAAPIGAKESRSSEPRRLSSNNPYANEYHAVSPSSDVAVNSPLARKKSRPVALTIPPRISSKRSSQPLFKRDHTKPDRRPVSEPFDDDKFTSAQWSVPNTGSEIESLKVSSPLSELKVVVASIEPRTSSAELRLGSAPSAPSSILDVPAASRTEHRALTCDITEPESNPEISIVEALELELFEDDVAHNGSTLSINTEGFVSQSWTYDSTSKYWSKTLSWRDGQPYTGPILRIHRDADAVLLGKGVAPPEEPEARDQRPERASLGRSLGALAGRLSQQTIHSTKSEDVPAAQSTTRPISAFHSALPVTISPIRAMRPPRQSSGEMSPGSRSSLTKLPANSNRISLPRGQPSIVESAAAKTSTDPNNDPSVEHAGADDVIEKEESPPPLPVVNSPAKKAKRILGLRKDTPPENGRRRLSPSWMAPTLSSLRAKTDSNVTPSRGLGRLSNRDFRGSGSSASAGTSSPVLQRSVSRVGPSKLRTSSSATPLSIGSSEVNSVSRSTQTPLGWVEPPLPAAPPHEDILTVALPPAPTAEVKKTSTLRLKAKRSFRNIFPKNETKARSTSTAKIPEPIAKPYEPKRASIATSGKTLAKRISRNFTKVHLPLKTPDVPNAALQNLDDLTKRQATLAALEDASPIDPHVTGTESTATLHYETAEIVNNLLSAIATMNPPSPESLRRLDMAEVVLHVAELVKQSQLSTEKARKYAREAELHAERIKIELGRLDVLMDFDFADPEIKMVVAQLKELRKMVDEAKMVGLLKD